MPHSSASLSLLRTTRRKFLIFGAAALLVLGAIAFFIASREPGKQTIVEKTETNKREYNEYFQKLIHDGKTSENDLDAIARIESFGGTFIGITRDALPWSEAEAVAKKAAGTILNLSQLGRARLQLPGWLGNTYPDTIGKTTWILDGAEPLGIDSPDFGPVSTLDRPRRAFVFWPGTMPTGWEWSVEPRFDEALPFEDGVARVRVGEKWGLIDSAGKEIHAPAFAFIGKFTEHGCAVIYQGEQAAIEILRNSEPRTWPFGMPGPEVPVGVSCGLMDRSGKILATADWEDVQNHIHGFTPVKRDGKWGYLDGNGQLAISCEWDAAWRFSAEGFAVVTREGKRGMIDKAGKIIVQPEWDGALNFCKEGIGAVRREAGWALVDSSGTLLTAPVWQLRWQDRRFNLGFIPAISTVDKKATLLGKDGKPVVPMHSNYFPLRNGVVITHESGENIVYGEGAKELHRFFGNISEAGEGLLLVLDGARFGLLDGNGNWAVQLQNGKARTFVGGMLAFTTGTQWGFMDLSGKIAVSAKWDEVRDFREGLAAVRKQGRWGFVDQNGRTVVTPRFEMAGDFSCGVAAVTGGDGKPPVANRAQDPELVNLANLLRQRDPAAREKMRTLSPQKRNELNAIMNSSSQRGQSRRWEFIDTSGTIAFEITSTQFSSPPRFYNDRLYVYEHGYINPQGKPVAGTPETTDAGTVAAIERPGNYHDRHGVAGALRVLRNAVGNPIMEGVKSGEDFRSGAMPHAIPPKYGLMDARGNVLVEPKWDEVRILSKDWVWIGAGGKCGIADAKGNVILEPVWDEVRAISPEWLWFRKGEKCGLADASGKVIVEPEYDLAEVLKVRSASVDEESGEMDVGPFGRTILSPWIRVRDGSGYRILRSDGQSAVPSGPGLYDFVDFYGPKHIVMLESKENQTTLWSLYEPATGTKTEFPNAERLYWNWSMSLAGLLWALDKADSKWKLMSEEGRDLGHALDEKPGEWEAREGVGLLQDDKGWFFINSKGQRIGGDGWTNARPFREGLAAVERNGKWGFIDKEGKLITEPQWSEVRDFHLGLAAVKTESGLWGFVGIDGKVQVHPVWDTVQDFVRAGGDPSAVADAKTRRVALVYLRYEMACIDSSGRLVLEPGVFPKPGQEFILHDGLHIERDKRTGTYRVAGWAVGGEEGSASNIWSTSIPVSWLYADSKGRVLTHRWLDADRRYEWQYVDDGSPVPPEELAAVSNRRGYADFGRVPVIGSNPLVAAGRWEASAYDGGQTDSFSGGRITAKSKNGKYALLRMDGAQVLPPMHDRIAWVAPGVAAVWSRQEGGLMDAEGQWIFRDNDKIRIARFGTSRARSTADPYRHGLIVIEDSPKWGYAKLKR